MLVLRFQVGNHHLALDVRWVREVVPRVRLQPVAGSTPWLAGVFLYRGQAVPVIDLYRLLRAGDCPVHLSTRIILVPHEFDGQEQLVGLLAAKVADVCEMPPTPLTPRRLAPDREPGNEAAGPDLGPIVVQGQEIVHLVELDRLLPASYHQQLVLLAKELPA